MSGNQEFDTPQEALAHYGVKGMKWGVTKKEETTGRDDAKGKKSGSDFRAGFAKLGAETDHKKLQSESQKKLEAQASQTFPMDAKQLKRETRADTLQKRAGEWDAEGKVLREKAAALPEKGVKAKYQRSNLEATAKYTDQQRDDLLKAADQVRAGKLTDQQKKLIAVGAGVAVTGLLLYGSAKLGENKPVGFDSNGKPITKAQANKRAKEDNKRRSEEEWRELFGKDAAFEDASGYHTAKGTSFHPGFYPPPPKILDRPEFTIPEGYTFQRLSGAQEDSSQYGTSRPAYSTFLSNDKRMYGASGEFGSKPYTVTYTAKGPTRVPSVSKVLETFKQVYEEENPGVTFPDKDIVKFYRNASGSRWDRPEHTKVLESLKKQGYSALVDDMDAGYMGDLPIIFFGDANPATSTPRPPKHKSEDAAAVLKVGFKYA